MNSVKDIAEYVTSICKYQKLVIVYDFKGKEIVEEFYKEVRRDCSTFLFSYEQVLKNKDILLEAFAGIFFGDGLNAKNIISDFPKECKVIEVLSSNFTLGCATRRDLTVINFCYEKSLIDLMFAIDGLISYKWQNLLLFKNYQLEFNMLENLFYDFENSSGEKFMNTLVKILKEIDFSFDFSEFDKLEGACLKNKKNIDGEVSNYFYVRMIALLFLFETSRRKKISICDSYADFENDEEAINMIYNIYFDERINFVLKNCCENMLELFDKIFIKINNYFNINNEEFNYLIKILKNNAKMAKNDNLLKISYIYGVFN